MKLGTLTVDITADAKQLMKSLQDSENRLRDFGKSARASINKIGQYTAGATAAAAAIGTVLVKQQLKYVDALAKTSDKLGVTTEALGGLRYAAELSGVAAGTLDMALQRMTRRVAEAANGTGEAKDAIKQLNLDAKALAALSPDQQFQKIAGAMTNVASQGEKVRLAFKLFDSEGVSLVNTLALGEQGLRDMAREADELGVTVSRVEAAQIEAANDALTRAASVMDGAVRRATVDLAPLIESVANEFVGVVAETDNLAGSTIDMAKAMVTPIGWILDGIRGIKIAVKGVEVVFRGLAYGAVADFNLIARGWTELANLLPGIDVDYDQTFLGRLEQSTKDAVATATKELQDLAMQKLPSAEIDDFLDRIGAASEKAAKRIAANRNALIAGGGNNGGNNIDIGAAEDQQKRLDALRQQYQTESSLLAAHKQKLADLDALYSQISLKQEAETSGAILEIQRKLQSDLDGVQEPSKRAEIEARAQQEIIQEKQKANAQQIQADKDKNAILLQVEQEHQKAMADLAIQRAAGGPDAASRIEALRTQFDTEATLKADHLQAMQDLEILFAEDGYATEAEKQAIREQMEQDHMDRLADIRYRGMTAIERIMDGMRDGDLSSWASYFAKATEGLSQHSKKAFQINKIAALANASISMYEGIAAGLKLGWPMSVPAVAYAAATGAAQIQSIRSQSYGGGGGAGASGSAISPSNVSAAGQSQDVGRNLTIDLSGLDDGASYSGATIRRLISGINEAIADGAVLRTEAA